MQQITSYNQLFTNISEHPEYPYIIIDFLVVNDEKVDLWCSQRKVILLLVLEIQEDMGRSGMVLGNYLGMCKIVSPRWYVSVARYRAYRA